MATTNKTINFKPILKIQNNESLKDTPDYSAIVWGKDSYGEDRSVIIGDNNISYESNQNFILGNNNKIKRGSYTGIFGENNINKDGDSGQLIVGNTNIIDSSSPEFILIGDNNTNIVLDYPGQIYVGSGNEAINQSGIACFLNGCSKLNIEDSAFVIANNTTNSNISDSIAFIESGENISSYSMSFLVSSNDNTIQMQDVCAYFGMSNNNIKLGSNNLFFGVNNSNFGSTEGTGPLVFSFAQDTENIKTSELNLLFCDRSRDCKFDQGNIVLSVSDENINVNTYNLYSGENNSNCTIDYNNIAFLDNSDNCNLSDHNIVIGSHLSKLNLTGTLVVGETISGKNSLDVGLIIGRNIENANGSYTYILGDSLTCPDNSNFKFIFGKNNDAKDNTIVEIANDGNIFEIDKDAGIVNLPKVRDEDIENAPDTTLVTKSYVAKLNDMNQVAYEDQKTENTITVNIDKYVENKINIVDICDAFESNDYISLIFSKNEKACLGELILKVYVKKFLSSNYEKYIQVNTENSFINLKVDSNDVVISNDYFLENMISSFYENESSNIDKYKDGDKIVFKFSIQAELENYILIGPIAIYIEHDPSETAS